MLTLNRQEYEKNKTNYKYIKLCQIGGKKEKWVSRQTRQVLLFACFGDQSSRSDMLGRMYSLSFYSVGEVGSERGESARPSFCCQRAVPALFCGGSYKSPEQGLNLSES